MICVLEIALLVFGIMALVNGKVTFDQKTGLSGGPAYLAGLIMLIPLPLALLIGFYVGYTAAQQGRDFTENQVQLALIEGGIAVGAVVLVGLLFAVASGPLPGGMLKRGWRGDEEDDRRRDRDRDRDDRDDRDRRDDEPRDSRGIRGEDDDYDRRRDPRIRGDE